MCQVCDGVHVDVLTGSRYSGPDPGMEFMILNEEYTARQRWYAQISVWHTQQQTGNPLEMTAAKLAKLWVHKVAFPLWNALLRPRGFMIETMVKHVCQSGSNVSRSGWDVFVDFLRFCSKEELMVMWNWREYSDHPRISWGSGPRVLDPLNPTNNLARQFRYWEDLRKQARETLGRILHVSPSLWTTGGMLFETDTVASRSPSPKVRLEEVQRALSGLGLPQGSIQALLNKGFTSLEYLCEFLEAQDLEDRRLKLNLVQRRVVLKAVNVGGSIHRKLQVEDRLPAVTEDLPRVDTPCSETREASFMSCPAGVAQEGRCFVPGTLLPTPGEVWQKVEDLRVNQVLLGRDKMLKMVRIQTHEKGLRWLITLQTEATTLQVTESHRVVVMEGDRELLGNF